jgi:murein DD-endopeptidase MepM/ murein hydrolase activator NlpD
MRRQLALLGISVLVLATGALAPAPASGFDSWSWLRPVPGQVVRPFRAPLTRFGRGHLGVDFASPPGTPVRAAGPGTVEVAGVIAGARYVVGRHAGGLRTSYSFLASVRVRKGQVLHRGAVVGRSGGQGRNHEAGVFHFGLRIGAAYVDPMRLFRGLGAGADLTTRVHLAPISDPDESWGRPLHWPRFRTDPEALTQSFARP